jgi:hypothetical protein
MYSWSTPQFSRSHTAKKNYIRRRAEELGVLRSVKKCACFFSEGVGKQIFIIRQIANLQILGLFRHPQISKFLRCASPRITNPQIFMIYRKIANLQIATKYCTTLSQTDRKVVLLNDFCVMYKFELEHLMKYL